MSADTIISESHRTESNSLVIAVGNQKGGCGKTTTTLNLGGALAEIGKDVLLIDLDPQGHLSEDCGLGDEYDSDSVSLHDVLVDLSKQDCINEIVRSHDEVDIVPAHAQMFQTESELNNSIRREERLRLALGELEKDYDVILLDCPPNLGSLTNNALLAAERVLIPARPTSKSVKAIELLMHQKSALESGYSTEIDVVGVVGNEVSYDNESEEMMNWLEGTFKDIAPVFAIRSRVALQRAADNFGSIFAHSEECDMEDEYLQIAESLTEDKPTQEGHSHA